MEVQTVAIVASLILTFVGMAIGGVWKLSRVEQALREAITTSKEDIEAKSDKSIHDVGETIQAIRQKVTEVELDISKNYVRRDGYYKERAELASDIEKLGDRIEKRIDKMEAKLDEK